MTKHWRSQNLCPPLGEVPQGGGGIEHAAALLEKIKAKKEQLIKGKKIKKEKPLPKITEEDLPAGKAGIPYELPDGWVWCRFQEIIIDIEAGKSPRCNPENADDNEWGVIKRSAISLGDFNSEENKALPIGAEVFAEKEIKEGDFILTRANTSELIAKSVIVYCGVRPRLLLNDKTLRFKFFNNISPNYVNLYNNGLGAREHYKAVSTGTSDSMQNISRDNIKLLKFPFPPLEEQKAIVTKVNSLMTLCDQLEQQIEQNTEQVEDLMKSCLRPAFAAASAE